MTQLLPRQITVGVALGANTGTNQPNTFAGTGGNTVTISGARTSVRIKNSGSPVSCTAGIKIWGLAPSLMNELATLGLVWNIVPNNTLTIQAGDAVNGTSAVFSGQIWNAYGDYSSQPDVPFHFDCLSQGYDRVALAAPTSFQGSASVVNIMQTLAGKMGLGFENNGVSASLNGAYFSGPLMIQAQKCAEHAHVGWGIVSGQGGGQTLAIWPLGGARNTQNVPVISPATGMISYPAFTQQGVVVDTLFNPAIQFGGLVQVQSSLLDGVIAAQSSQNAQFRVPTNSTWAVNQLDLALDSLLPRGEWKSTAALWNPNYQRPMIQPAGGP